MYGIGMAGGKSWHQPMFDYTTDPDYAKDYKFSMLAMANYPIGGYSFDLEK